MNPDETIDPRIALLSKLPKDSICAEIGVWKGDYSDAILYHVHPKKLHLIDPWKFYTTFGKRWYGGMVAKEQRDMDDIYESVKEKFKDRNEVEFHRQTSEEAAKSFEDNYFDWVYIDGNHYYEFVKKDLEMYLPKTKKGGYLAGDDYNWTSEELNGELPVKKAVDEFVEKYGFEIEIIDYQFIIKIS